MWLAVHERKAGFYTNIPINHETKHLFTVLMDFNTPGTEKAHLYFNGTFMTLTIIDAINSWCCRLLTPGMTDTMLIFVALR